MDNEHKILIINLKEKLTELISQNGKLKTNNLQLQNDLGKQKEDLMAAHRDILEWKSKYDSLRMAKTMVISESDITFAQERLSNLVRRINKCIALINQQQ